MNDLKSNVANEVRQYILDVLSGKRKTDDKCLDNFAKAIRKYENSNCIFGEIIDNSISQMKAAVEKLKLNIKKQQ